MQTHFSHLQFNVRPGNLPFYRELMAFLGWSTIHDDDGFLGVGGPHETSLWFVGQVKEIDNDYDGPGLNHLGIGTGAQADVDATAAYLRERGVELLFETPRHRSEFSDRENTYYQVMFESPDRILLEVVYQGPRSA
jgi:catechol 2,3-dioxygenase-like lactoylglutathione lyase family enzyme